jgi:hypothetical protein
LLHSSMSRRLLATVTQDVHVVSPQVRGQGSAPGAAR